MPQQNQNVLPSGAGVGLQWARRIAAVVLSIKLPEASALGRLRLLQEVLSIVDLLRPISTRRSSSAKRDLYMLPHLLRLFLYFRSN